ISGRPSPGRWYGAARAIPGILPADPACRSKRSASRKPLFSWVMGAGVAKPSRRFAQTSRESLLIPRRRDGFEATLVDVESFDLRLERRGRHAEFLGRAERARHPAPGLCQGGLDHGALLGVSPPAQPGRTRLRAAKEGVAIRE